MAEEALEEYALTSVEAANQDSEKHVSTEYMSSGGEYH